MAGNNEFGHPVSKETRQKLRLRYLGKHVKWGHLPEMDITYRLLNTGATTRSIAEEYGCSDSTIKKIFRKHSTEGQRLQVKANKHGDKIKGRKNPALKEWLKEHWEEVRAKAIKAMHNCPNKWEMATIGLLNEACPNEYEFVGDGACIIGGLNPDFVNTNGKKKVIEVFGEYWHLYRGLRTWHQTELGRIMRYNALGYDCLILWAHDIQFKPRQEMIEYIIKFHQFAKRSLR